jgi:hypothetical protein
MSQTEEFGASLFRWDQCLFDKYGLISLHNDIMFFYVEEPTIVAPPTIGTVVDAEHTWRLAHTHGAALSSLG